MSGKHHQERHQKETIDKDRIALGIRQPWIELILQGKKTIEVRSQSTNVRGRIYLYASKKVAPQPFALEAITQHQLAIDELPKGLLLGSVEIVDCRKSITTDAHAACVPASVLKNHYCWQLANPIRFDAPMPVKLLPYGVWFYPFKRRG